jgi:hypothetical protein
MKSACLLDYLLFYVLPNFDLSCVSWNLPDEEHSCQHYGRKVQNSLTL